MLKRFTVNARDTSSQFPFTITNTGRSRVVSVRGEIAFTNARDFRVACEASADRRPTVIDLRRCAYMDSSGLAALADQHGRSDMAIVLRPDARCYRIFEIAELLNRFTIAPTIGAAFRLLMNDDEANGNRASLSARLPVSV